VDQKTLQKLTEESEKEIAQISKGFESKYADALVGDAKKAIDQALLEMFGTRKDADDAKKAIIENLQRVIKTFNDGISKEFHAMMTEQKEKLRADIVEEFKKMRGEFMAELKNL